MANRKIIVKLRPSDSVKPVSIEGAEDPPTQLDGERLYVEKGVDTIEFESANLGNEGQKPVEFSVFFPNGATITDEPKNRTDQLKPLNGGDVFNSTKDGKTHKIKNLHVSGNLELKRAYEYYITVTNPHSDLVYTDDPDVYVDC